MRLSLFTRCALALAAMQALGCEQRERWPEKTRHRERPKPLIVSDGFDCNHGTFCVPAPASVSVPAQAPHGHCGVTVALPGDEATDVPDEKRPTLRVRFNSEETSAQTKVEPDAGDGQRCCYTWFEHCRGRPFVHDGRSLVADVVSDDRWQLGADDAHWPEVVSELARCDRPDVHARGWLREARHEHASVAAFSRLALQLMRVGAPHDLVAACVACARDELRHARVAFAIASAYAGEALGPGRWELPPDAASRGQELRTELAASSFLEGCVGETISAAILRACLPMLPSALGAVMRQVAADEERHAAFSWRVTAWCVRASDAREAVRGCARRIHGDPLQLLLRVEDDVPAYGVLSRCERRLVAQQTLCTVVQPLTGLLLSPPVARGSRARRGQSQLS